MQLVIILYVIASVVLKNIVFNQFYKNWYYQIGTTNSQNFKSIKISFFILKQISIVSSNI